VLSGGAMPFALLAERIDLAIEGAHNA
jgi:hypothetical protein